MGARVGPTALCLCQTLRHRVTPGVSTSVGSLQGPPSPEPLLHPALVYKMSGFLPGLESLMSAAVYTGVIARGAAPRTTVVDGRDDFRLSSASLSPRRREPLIQSQLIVRDGPR